MLKMNYDFPDAEGLVVCGDIHGKFDELVYRMTKLCRMEHTVVIVAGDCGFGSHRRGYYDEVYRRALPKLERADCHVVFVRGNHDNPAYFDGEEISMKRWVAVSDYSTVTAAGHRVLCVGGATSVDRKNRESYSHPLYVPKPDYGKWFDEHMAATMQTFAEHRMTLAPADYWPLEQPYIDESALARLHREGKTVDTVVTHVAPPLDVRGCGASIVAGVPDRERPDAARRHASRPRGDGRPTGASAQALPPRAPLALRSLSPLLAGRHRRHPLHNAEGI